MANVILTNPAELAKQIVAPLSGGGNTEYAIYYWTGLEWAKLPLSVNINGEWVIP